MSRALGIDIGSISIKVAEIETTTKGQEIIGLYEIVKTQDQTEAELLQNFLATTHVPTSRVQIGIGQCNSIVRKMQFPFKDAKRVRLAVQSELEDQLPFPLDNFVVDFRLNRRVGRMFEFIVGVCPMEQVEKINAMTTASGFQPAALLDDTQALAEFALAQKLPASDMDQPYAICDVGLRHSRIAIVKGRNAMTLYKEKGIDPFPAEIIELRKLERGSLEWVQYISDRRKVTLEEAKSWLIHRAEIQTSANDLQSIKQDLSDDVKSALRPWVVELYQTFQACRVAHGMIPTTLYLTGGMIDIAGMKEFLSHELRLGVSTWPIAIGFGTERYQPSESDNRGFASALALAASVCKKERGSWLNFKRSTNPNQKFLTETLLKLLNPINRRPVTFIASMLVGLWIYAGISQSLLAKRMDDSRDLLLAEIRKHDGGLANTAKSSGTLLSRSETRSLVGKIIQARTRQENKGPAPVGRAASEVLLDLSAVLPKGGLLRTLKIKDQMTATSVVAQIVGVTDQTESNRVTQALTAKGYSDIQAKVGAGGLDVEGRWTSVKRKEKKK
jgi:Tfp pilus assembly PilM family ATPase